MKEKQKLLNVRAKEVKENLVTYYTSVELDVVPAITFNVGENTTGYGLCQGDPFNFRGDAHLFRNDVVDHDPRKNKFIPRQARQFHGFGEADLVKRLEDLQQDTDMSSVEKKLDEMEKESTLVTQQKTEVNEVDAVHYTAGDKEATGLIIEPLSPPLAKENSTGAYIEITIEHEIDLVIGSGPIEKVDSHAPESIKILEAQSKPQAEDAEVGAKNLKQLAVEEDLKDLIVSDYDKDRIRKVVEDERTTFKIEPIIEPEEGWEEEDKSMLPDNIVDLEMWRHRENLYLGETEDY